MKKQCKKCQTEFIPSKGLVNFCSNKCKCSRETKSYIDKLRTKSINFYHKENHYDFLDNKYTKLYFKILNKSTLSSNSEKHHVIPKSLGGHNNFMNLRRISTREHFICHYLLTKMIPTNTQDYYKMVKAFMMMKMGVEGDHQRYFNSHLYKSKRIEFGKAQSYYQQGNKHSQYGSKWMYLEDESKKVKAEEVNKHLEMGWEFGRHKKIFNLKCAWCCEDYKSEIKRRKYNYCSDQCQVNFNTYKSAQKASDYFFEFINGEYDSIRDFCRNNDGVTVSHVSILAMWKKYIIGLKLKMGESFSSLEARKQFRL